MHQASSAWQFQASAMFLLPENKTIPNGELIDIDRMI